MENLCAAYEFFRGVRRRADWLRLQSRQHDLGQQRSCGDFRCVRQTAQLTDVEAISIVHSDSRLYAQNLMRVWDVALRKDKTITENNQLGVNSSAYRPGRYSTQGKRISEFVEWYMRLPAGRSMQPQSNKGYTLA